MQLGAALGALLLLALAADGRRLDADFEFDDDASPPVSTHRRLILPTTQTNVPNLNPYRKYILLHGHITCSL